MPDGDTPRARLNPHSTSRLRPPPLFEALFSLSRGSKKATGNVFYADGREKFTAPKANTEE